MLFASINGVTIHYRSAGRADAPPVVFCNSLGTDARIWDEVISALAGRYRLVSYDKRGHGLSDAPEGPYSIDDHLDDLLGLADRLGLESFALAGVSVGGLVAQAAASRHPGRIEALVLCNTASKLGTTEIWNDRIALIEAGGMASIADAVLERWFGVEFRTTRTAELRGWRNLLWRTDAKGYAATCATLRDTDLTRELGSIVAPTLVVAGADDISTPPALVRELASRIDTARFELIAGAGHIPSIEQPAVLGRLIGSFFEEVGYG